MLVYRIEWDEEHGDGLSFGGVFRTLKGATDRIGETWDSHPRIEEAPDPLGYDRDRMWVVYHMFEEGDEEIVARIVEVPLED